jgi:hypothetical protein
MKIENVDLLQKAVERADTLQKKLEQIESPEGVAEREHYKRMCELADRPAGNLIPPINNDPDSAYTTIRECDSPMVDFEANNERKRIARLALRNPAEAAKQSAELEASQSKQRPMTLPELLAATQQARIEVRNATKSGVAKRLENANRRLRALHREKNRRGSIRVAC